MVSNLLISCVAWPVSVPPVSLLVNLSGPQGFAVSVAPRQLLISKGCSASIECRTGEPATFAWLFNYGPLHSGVQLVLDAAMSSTLSLSRISVDDQGLYTCVANSTGRSVSSSSTAFLNVVGALQKWFAS